MDKRWQQLILLKSILLTLLLMASVLGVNGQHLPYGLREKKVKHELLARTTEFDSLILIDKASYWNDDMTIHGLGFKQEQIYRVTIRYEDDTTTFYDMLIQDFRQEKIDDNLTIQAIRKVEFKPILNLNNDSLNFSGAFNISDMPEWTILYLGKGLFVLKQVYAPDYQPSLPTKDRQLFLNSIDQLSKLLN